MNYEIHQFIGSWELISWTIQQTGRDDHYPFGENAQGLLIYTDDGKMSAAVSRQGRPVFDTKSVRGAPTEEQAAAFSSYFHYGGDWVLENDYVMHQVTTCLNPNFTGTNQKRKARFLANNQLELSAEESLGNDKTRHHVILWQRP